MSALVSELELLRMVERAARALREPCGYDGGASSKELDDALLALDRFRNPAEFVYLSAENCVRCMTKAKLHSGHVVKDGEVVTAGWCSDECADKIAQVVSPTGAGCVGQWHPALGLQRDRKPREL
jgi:hypothetical protein